MADWQPYRKIALKLQLRKAAKSLNHSYNFELPNKSDEANATAHPRIRFLGTMMRDHFRICTKKGVANSITKQKIFFFFEGCEEVGVVKIVHLFPGEVRRVATALKVVEEVQEEVQD